MSLSSDDYENIYLRVKDKLFSWIVFFFFAAVSIPVGVITYFGMEKIIESKLTDAVETQLKTEDFSAQLTASVSGKIDQLNHDIALIENSLMELSDAAKNLSNFAESYPLDINGNRISIQTSMDRKFVLESGNCAEYGEIKFSGAFESAPTVFITACHPTLERQPHNAVAIDVTNTGFRIFSNRFVDINNKYSWVAISHKN